MPQTRGARQAVAEERRRVAFELRKAGATFDEIGRHFGITRQSAFALVTKVLVRLRAQTAEDAEEVHTLELARLDAMLKGLWPKASAGHVHSVDKALRIMERRARMLGTDAPTKHAYTDPTGQQERTPATFPVPPDLTLEQWQAHCYAALKPPQPST